MHTITLDNTQTIEHGNLFIRFAQLDNDICYCGEDIARGLGIDPLATSKLLIGNEYRVMVDHKIWFLEDGLVQFLKQSRKMAAKQLLDTLETIDSRPSLNINHNFYTLADRIVAAIFVGDTKEPYYRAKDICEFLNGCPYVNKFVRHLPATHKRVFSKGELEEIVGSSVVDDIINSPKITFITSEGILTLISIYSSDYETELEELVFENKPDTKLPARPEDAAEDLPDHFGFFSTDDGLELVIDRLTGECFASIKATARMAGVETSSIRYFIRERDVDIKWAIIPTAGGSQRGRLLPEETILTVLRKYNPDLLQKCASAGLRVYLHRLAGFEVQSTALTPPVQEPEISPPATYLDALKALVSEVEKGEQTQAQLVQAEQTIDGYRSLLSEEVTLTMKQVADGLNIKGLGRNNLVKYLREAGFIVPNGTVPYRRFIEQGKAIVVTKSIVTNHRNVHAVQSTQLTFSGLCWLVNQLRKDDYPVGTSARAIWDHYEKCANKMLK